MNQVLQILEQLSDKLPSVEQVRTLREPYANRWHKIRDDRPDTNAAVDIEWLLAAFPLGLSRTDIRQIADSKATTRRRRVLIASLMWGYGTHGRVSDADLTALLTSPQLDTRLEQVDEQLADGDVRTAYESLPKTRGIRSAYFTKVLYFLGLAHGEDWEYPLILDSMVSEALAWLTSYRLLVKVEAWPQDDSDSYVRYVHSMHQWARHLGTEADLLEFFLWERRGEAGLAEICTEHYDREV